MPTPRSPGQLHDILADALARTWDEMPRINTRHSGINKDWAVDVRNFWVRSLCASFRYKYRQERFAVFGGKPLPLGSDFGIKQGNLKKGSPDGIAGWGVWEFLYDISVVQKTETLAAYNGSDIVFVDKALWQIECEVANSGTEVAKDFSKLRIGRAANKLLIARATSQTRPEDWLRFIGSLARGITGTTYLGLMPSYSSSRQSEARKWHECDVSLTLYRCARDGSVPQPLDGGPIIAHRHDPRHQIVSELAGGEPEAQVRKIASGI